MVNNNKLFRWQDLGGSFLNGIWLRFRLMIRLLKDERINTPLKLIPLFCLVYLVLPLDIPGPFDDAAVVWFGMQLFIEFCPQEIVRGHLEELTNDQRGTHAVKNENVVDADFKEISKDE
jgi:uncharacterized membrane protein YkvA (DUF1232 family)